jgi:hypothetical protein
MRRRERDASGGESASARLTRAVQLYSETVGKPDGSVKWEQPISTEPLSDFEVAILKGVRIDRRHHGPFGLKRHRRSGLIVVPDEGMVRLRRILLASCKQRQRELAAERKAKQREQLRLWRRAGARKSRRQGLTQPVTTWRQAEEIPPVEEEPKTEPRAYVGGDGRGHTGLYVVRRDEERRHLGIDSPGLHREYLRGNE